MQNNPLIYQQLLQRLQAVQTPQVDITPGLALQNNLNNLLASNGYYEGVNFVPNNNNVLIPQVPQGVLPGDMQAQYINKQNELLKKVDEDIQKRGIINQDPELLKNININN